ncbi:type II toxin-antitoxin system RelE/ParE family toxin [Dehalobacterium formicoaceticum]|uniref:Type II toxin-antitoxin system RelE/ParE family toxin n=1 Tax=Dehalobacterium formicoaceticum TaxID=51515 RepID=A0ABT1Y6F9_9FIRM|nr:type II toxin-antitoxin system RelE/ParE family toxin [Dehalobacterium formicoaceticum]MCR6546470.1 type II toxin-antitoxin system RelE/ParE family toxin [Dehalobacterium formicoaceticum]
MTDKTCIVKITTQAEVHLREIVKYIASELMAPKSALRLLDEIESSISSLSQFPQRVTLTEEEPWRSIGIHKMPVKNFLLYFWIDEENRKVKQLSQMDME